MDKGNLVIERKPGEAFTIGDSRVVVRRIMGRRVWLNVQAVRDVPIVREELCELGSSGKEDEGGQQRAS